MTLIDQSWYISGRINDSKQTFIEDFDFFETKAHFMGVSQIVAGWWGHQPGRPAVGGVLTAHNHRDHATIWDAPHFIISHLKKSTLLIFAALWQMN